MRSISKWKSASPLSWSMGSADALDRLGGEPEPPATRIDAGDEACAACQQGGGDGLSRSHQPSESHGAEAEAAEEAPELGCFHGGGLPGGSRQGPRRMQCETSRARGRFRERDLTKRSLTVSGAIALYL